jgi:hypothetical protein
LKFNSYEFCTFVYLIHFIMTTLTIKINERTKAGKAFMAMSESFFKGVNGIEITKLEDEKSQMDESSYNPEFIAKVKKAEEEINKGNTARLNPNDIWGSIL